MDQRLLDGLTKLEQGRLREASDIIARYEQEVVVASAYARHSDTFDDMMWADSIDVFNDRTSIPIAKTCIRENLVSIDGLDIREGADRVKYYERLVSRMLEMERSRGPSFGGGSFCGGGASGTW